jgi:hypothetical protein
MRKDSPRFIFTNMCDFFFHRLVWLHGGFCGEESIAGCTPLQTGFGYVTAFLQIFGQRSKMAGS